jgi:alginate O-acetyltransferase complex protein AlgI
MVFSSPLFIFLFLPLFLGLYYALPERFRTGWILAGSWVFYGFWRVDFLGLLVMVSFGNWLAGILLARALYDEGRADRLRAKLIVGIAAGLNLAVLAYFKYFNFGMDSLNALLGLFGLGSLSAWSVILPVGISFYVFQAMSYVIDVYRRDAPPSHEFIDLAAYISLFPQLVAGPILRYKDLAGQLRQRRHSLPRFSYGLARFSMGLCRKVLIADTIAPLANAAFGMANPGAPDAWLGILAYAAQLYFDFSGYSDMAIGLGHMMGFSFIENFDTPYRAASISDFWRRWHISLSSWLRDYLYLPLGGNRKGRGRTYLNLFLVMAIGGLWHGAAWNFVAWGCWHGLLLGAERYFAARGKPGLKPGREQGTEPDAAHETKPGALAAALGLTFTQAAVLVGWVLFRARDLRHAFRYLSSLAGGSGWALSAGYAWRLGALELWSLAIGIVIIALEPRAKRHALEAEGAETRSRLALSWFAWILAGGVGVLKLLADSYSPFLYFQF